MEIHQFCTLCNRKVYRYLFCKLCGRCGCYDCVIKAENGRFWILNIDGIWKGEKWHCIICHSGHQQKR